MALQHLYKMILRLKDIATISSGVTFRSRIEASKNGNIRVIQMKDLGDDNLVHLDNSIQIIHPKPRPNQLAKSGDIIFRSRGQTNTAALLQEDVENTIVAAPLFRVQPDIKKVLPEYLVWWINQPASQAYLASRSKGTSVNMVGKQALETLEIKLPPLPQQQKITRIVNLARQEQQILEQIQVCKSAHIQAVLMQMTSCQTNKEPLK